MSLETINTVKTAEDQAKNIIKNAHLEAKNIIKAAEEQSVSYIITEEQTIESECADKLSNAKKDAALQAEKFLHEKNSENDLLIKAAEANRQKAVEYIIEGITKL